MQVAIAVHFKQFGKQGLHPNPLSKTKWLLYVEEKFNADVDVIDEHGQYGVDVVHMQR